ncbi:phytanoyl-CoA dioxygenase family protein [Oceanibacterium hippocampi]|uniref:Phytanoyl-CoA dioxygenase (PhyH) n=1 Tax=Oceanibacterium hippocampi TaxID=745714 RepID=A0A1Y5S0F7_9PROT|nr:phytanoyl-CoA dioxygenase family protein [Oceanibacterium hippocampi]SLN29621.1 Phytanoyl-CoA dioxygenase (PhyH) [Oceanibacterium hippocampi]
MADDYVRDYRERGFAVIRNVVSAAEIAALAEAFDRVHAQALAHGANYRDGNVYFRLGRDPVNGVIPRLVQWPSYFDDVLAGFRIDRRIGEIMAPLLGRDIKQIINQMHWKPPGAAAEFGLHQDIGFRRPREAYRNPATSYVQSGLAIDPHGPENGAMQVYPGSHRMGEIALPGDGPVMRRTLAPEELTPAGLDPARLETLELAPGDLALWGLYMLHGSGPNRSPTDRRFYLNGYVRATDCDRGEWAFRHGEPCPLGAPQLVHYEELGSRPGPFYEAFE